MTALALPEPNPAAVWRVCARKKAYGTYEHAVAVAIRRSWRSKPLRIYPCPYGHHWHLTSKRDRTSHKETA